MCARKNVHEHARQRAKTRTRTPGNAQERARNWHAARNGIVTRTTTLHEFWKIGPLVNLERSDFGKMNYSSYSSPKVWCLKPLNEPEFTGPTLNSWIYQVLFLKSQIGGSSLTYNSCWKMKWERATSKNDIQMGKVELLLLLFNMIRKSSAGSWHGRSEFEAQLAGLNLRLTCAFILGRNIFQSAHGENSSLTARGTLFKNKIEWYSQLDTHFVFRNEKHKNRKINFG